MERFEVQPTSNGVLRLDVGNDYRVLLVPAEMAQGEIGIDITVNGFRLLETAEATVHGQPMTISLFTTVDPVTIQKQMTQAGGILLRTQRNGGFQIIIGIEQYVVVLFDDDIVWLNRVPLAPKDYQRALQPMLTARWQKISDTVFSFRGVEWRAVLLQFGQAASTTPFDGLALQLGPSVLKPMPQVITGLEVWQIERPRPAEYKRVWHHGAIFRIDGNTMLICVGENESAQTDIKLLEHLEQQGWYRITSRDRRENIAGFMRTYTLHRDGQLEINDSALAVFDLYNPFDLVGEMAVIEDKGALIFLTPCQPVQKMNVIAGTVERKTGLPCQIMGPTWVELTGDQSVEVYRLIVGTGEAAGPETHERMLSVFQPEPEAAAA